MALSNMFKAIALATTVTVATFAIFKVASSIKAKTDIKNEQVRARQQLIDDLTGRFVLIQELVKKTGLHELRKEYRHLYTRISEHLQLNAKSLSDSALELLDEQSRDLFTAVSTA